MWVEITTKNLDSIRDILTFFDVHPFVLEDVSITEQRMKISTLQDDIYLLLDLIYLDVIHHVIEQQKIRLYLRANSLITIQEYRTPRLFSEIKYRLQKKPMPQSKGRLKNMKIDYLFYCLLNVIIESYVDLLESILHETERLDKELMFSTNSTIDTLNVETLKSMFHIKHELLHFKIVCGPLKDIMIKLQKTRETVVPVRQRPALRQCRRRLKRRRAVANYNHSHTNRKINSTGEDDDEYIPDDGVLVLNDYIYKYFKRLQDHAVQLNDTIDSYSDIITSLIDFYMVLDGDIINDTMHTLTIMSCIFMPLNFFSSLSSMNYKYMFQIRRTYGYFVQLSLMGFIGIIMIIVFKLQKLF